MRKSLLSVLVVLGLVGMLAAPAAAGHDRPFKTKARLVEVTEVAGCDVSEYTGTGTHLGRFVLEETLCFQGPPLDGVIGFTVEGVFTAANGDQLEYFVDAYFVLPAGPVLEGGFDFTGGTGRFADADGSGFTIFTDKGIVQKGRISY